MNQLNFQRNLFLEVEELNSWQDFTTNDLSKFLFQSNTESYGIVLQGDTGNEFLIEAGSNSKTVKMTTKSYAVNSSMLLMTADTFDNMPLPADDTWYWLKIAHRYSHYEPGLVSVGTNGQIVGSVDSNGNNTDFTALLRGQTTNKPTRIKFYDEDEYGNEVALTANTDTYQIEEVLDAQNMIISGELSSMSNVRYVIVGTHTLGTTITSDIKEGLYEYNNILYTFVAGDGTDTPPSGLVANDEFYIARVYYNSSTAVLTIQDKRTNYWSLNFGDVSIVNKADRDAANVTGSYLTAWKTALGVVSGTTGSFIQTTTPATITETLTDTIGYVEVLNIEINGISRIDLPVPSDANEGNSVIFNIKRTDAAPIAFTLGIDGAGDLRTISGSGREYTLVYRSTGLGGTWKEVINASEAAPSEAGISEPATNTTTETGTSVTQYVTPNSLKHMVGSRVKRKVVDILNSSLVGWDMDAVPTFYVPHGLSALSEFVACEGHIVNDAGTTGAQIPFYVTAMELWYGGIDATDIAISRRTGGLFDSVDFDDDSISRGKLIIFYID